MTPMVCGEFTLPYTATQSNTSGLMTITNQANGYAASFKVDQPVSTSAAVRGEVNSRFANFGAAGIHGIASVGKINVFVNVK